MRMGATQTRLTEILRTLILISCIGMGADVLEVINSTHNHFATGGGAVVLKHVG